MQCIICYYEIPNNQNSNNHTHQCTLCKNKFHTTCINRWLKESDNCPLCRGLMISLEQQIIDDVKAMCNIQ